MAAYDYLLNYEVGKIKKVEEINELTTQQKIDILFKNFKKFLKEKNKRYGNSALNPIKIFCKEESMSQIYHRLDDKLSRIKRAKKIKKNDLSDLFGYTALALIENDWITFDEFLD